MASETAENDQENAVKQFIDLCNNIGISCTTTTRRRNISHSTAVKFLYARKFDVPRAVSLYEQHEQIRLKECLYNINPDVEPLRSELQTGKFTILPGRDIGGAAIAVFTANKHSPFNCTHTITLQGIVYQLDAALQDTETQKAGLVFIYDMSGSKYSNFDYDLSQKILTLLKGGYPARLKKVLIVTAPLWFKAPFKILRLFVHEKLRERVFTVSVPTLSLHVPRKVLPSHLGGTIEIDHNTWLLHCRKSMTNREDELLANIGQPAIQANGTGAATTNTTITTVNNHITIGGDRGGSRDNSILENGTSIAVVAPNGTTGNQQQDDSNENSITNINQSTTTTTTGAAEISAAAAAAGAAGATLPTATTTNRKVGNAAAADVFVNGVVNGAIARTRLPSSNGIDADNGAGEEWAENPPSSASSGFSDDDSLAGQEGDPKTMEQIVEMLLRLKYSGMALEYRNIRTRAPDGTFDNARLMDNMTKNRYTDVLCYDHSRVVLSREDADDESSDYINANYVDGYKQKNAFISTQGPLPKTSSDFWRMIWEQQVLVIVMTTRVKERGREKCGQYWEPSADSSIRYGNFHVRTINIETNAEYTVASLELKNIKTEEKRNVSHFQFTSWPDYGVPNSGRAMLNFMKKVREKQAELVKEMGDTWAGHALGPPIVVHCSAGIGRTGTFITLDICIARLEDVGTVDIRGTVERIRTQRAYSIQMPEQYVFCHLALVEYAISRGIIGQVDLSAFDDRPTPRNQILFGM